jgi:hypothetical protein
VSTAWVSDRLAAAAPIGLAELDAAAGLQHRIDTKYLITPQQLDQVADRLSSTHRRLVIDGISAFAYRSSYLDTPGHACFHAHRQGRRLRFKIRTRCYDDTGLCRFEIKLKDGRGGTDKHARTVSATQFATVPDLAPAFVSDVLAARYGIAAPTDLAPRLLVSHHRHTLAARSGACRVTLDTGLRFTAGPITAGLHDDLVLVETKSARGRSDADGLLRRAGARPVNLSKYCAGMALTHPHLPDQPWRPLLRRCFISPHPANSRGGAGHHSLPSHAATGRR